MTARLTQASLAFLLAGFGAVTTALFAELVAFASEVAEVANAREVMYTNRQSTRQN